MPRPAPHMQRTAHDADPLIASLNTQISKLLVVRHARLRILQQRLQVDRRRGKRYTPVGQLPSEDVVRRRALWRTRTARMRAKRLAHDIGATYEEALVMVQERDRAVRGWRKAA